MEITWQEIVDKLSFTQNKKLVKETVQVFYAALESNIDYECNIYIRNIGRFQGTIAGVRHKGALKRYNKSKQKFREKHYKRRQRLWVKEKFDSHWKD